ncbi:MAG: hypothetical protein AAGL10_01315 [Pseudomonadota bacterium]
MFGPDPIDWFDPSPYGSLAFYGHIAIGILALAAAFLAFAVRKGSVLHRRSGLVYMAACAFVCATSIAMLVQAMIPPLAMAVFTSIYAIGGAYLALRSGTRRVLLGEKSLFALELAAFGFFMAMAIPAIVQGFIPFYAPFVIAIIPVILLAGDVRWLRNPEKRKQWRIARHLSRMIWGFVVVVRAPLVELAAGGYLPRYQMLFVVGPIVAGVAMVWYFQRKFGGTPFGKAS